MTLALRFLEQFVLGKFLRSESTVKSLIRAGQVIAILSGVFILLGACFTLYGLYLALNTVLDPAWAALLTGLCSLVFAVLIGWCGWLYLKQRTKALLNFEPKRDLRLMASPALALLDQDINARIRHHPVGALILAALIGFISSRNL